MIAKVNDTDTANGNLGGRYNMKMRTWKRLMNEFELFEHVRLYYGILDLIMRRKIIQKKQKICCQT